MKKFLFIYLLFIFSCKQKEPDTLFIRLSAEQTGIDFNNKVTENDSINPIDMEFLYNGGGVAIGDFNNDSLPDIYFTASQVPNRLYLNKGNFRFEDITDKARVGGEGKWSNAASVVDINNDGLPDIYVCATISKNPEQRRNILYINQGHDKNGVPVFKDMAKEYNLADTGLSVHAAFFDYDNDGDLDMYLVHTKLAQRNSTRFDGSSEEDRGPLSDKLYRNDGDKGEGHPVFTDVSKEAGINDEGYGLGVAIADLNEDGWKDIYVTNDFFGSDLLYINQGNGTFINKINSCLKHTSQSAMGNDIADINNDGLEDIIAVDMNPEDNYRKKKNMNGSSYYIYQAMAAGRMMLQYTRNTLQLNNGIIKRDTGDQPLPVFSDIAFYAGVAETDWSWSPLLADFDNDGYRDLFITNGYPKDVTDHDFAFFQSSSPALSHKELSEKIPQIKIPNYAYRNTGGLRFENVTKDWGFSIPSFSNGAAYVDLDRDGDLDYVVNNINDKAFVFENTSEKQGANNYLNIRFKGGKENGQGIGAIAEVYYNDKMQVAENAPYRGYLSTMDEGVHFGLGNQKMIDQIIIKWPGGNKEVLENIPANQTITVDMANAFPEVRSGVMRGALFTDITSDSRVDYRHSEFDYIDFDIQRLLPHKLSEYGPGLAAGDVDGNGLDDLFIGPSAGFEGSFLLQQANGTFIQKQMLGIVQKDARKPEVLGVLLFDADGDGDPDLYTASGSNEFYPNTKNYQDRIYINDGKGNYSYDSAALPINYASKSCVKAADIDRDGDLDLFIGGRVIPQQYPRPASSFILRNDAKNGQVRFTDITSEAAPGLKNIGLVCDAVWSDYDNDGWPDLVVAGEWMPISFFHNKNGKLEDVTATSGLKDKKGWWNSIVAGDFDNDGDIDYVAGNVGLNTFYRGDSLHPVSIYAGDFGKNGSYVSIPSLYLPDEKGEKKEFPAHTRDDLIGYVPALKKKFLTYKSFAEAKMNQLFDQHELDDALKLTADYFSSSYIENKGAGKFSIHPLPAMAQFSSINGMIADDINEDGFLDLLICGNDYGTELTTGRYDAMNGLVMLGNGKGDFASLTLSQSGLFIPGNAKALVRLKGAGSSYLVAATQNKGALKIFQAKGIQLESLHDDDETVYYTLKNGQTRKEELYHGSSYLSQSSRSIIKSKAVTHVEVVNSKGERRIMN